MSNDLEVVDEKALDMYMNATVLPKMFQKNKANIYYAMELAKNLSVSPIAVMNGMYEVYGNPSFKGQFCLGLIKKHFGDYRFEESGSFKDSDYKITIHVGDLSTTLHYHTIKGEGWLSKKESKWLTMPLQMAKYRVGSWWLRAYAPELLLGCTVEGEYEDSDGYDHNKANKDLLRDEDKPIDAEFELKGE